MTWQGELEGLVGAPARPRVSDISMVIAVRSHDDNPWVLERLELLGNYYDPRPEVIVVDFGSQRPHREAVAAVARRQGYQLVYEPDEGLFSAARARNLGARVATGRYLFFSDVDCVGERNLFRKLCDFLDVSGWFERVDWMLNLPVYHFGEAASRDVLNPATADMQESALLRGLLRAPYVEAGGAMEYVDPFSNFFLCDRRFFELVGGYDEEFRGHGSEDFEFLLRFARHANNLPLPEEPLRNVYRPRREGSLGVKRYRGFRRLGELLAVPAEVAGLRLAHLHHPRERTGATWYGKGDVEKSLLREQARPYLENPAALCRYDWLPRDQEVLVALQDDDDWARLLPLRLLGLRLLPVDVARKGWAPVARRLEKGRGQVGVAFCSNGTSSEEQEELLARAGALAARTLVLASTADRGRYLLHDSAATDPMGDGLTDATVALFDTPSPWAGTPRPPLCTKLPGVAGNASLFLRGALEGGDVRRSYAATKLAVAASSRAECADLGKAVRARPRSDSAPEKE